MVAIVVILVLIVLGLIIYNITIYKKIQKFKNMNQRITNLYVVQDFMNAIGEKSTVEEKVKKPEELDTAVEKEEPINKKSENIKIDELPGDKTENISKIPFEIARIPKTKREKVITENIQDLSDYYKEADLKILID